MNSIQKEHLQLNLIKLKIKVMNLLLMSLKIFKIFSL